MTNDEIARGTGYDFFQPMGNVLLKYYCLMIRINKCVKNMLSKFLKVLICKFKTTSTFKKFSSMS